MKRWVFAICVAPALWACADGVREAHSSVELAKLVEEAHADADSEAIHRLIFWEGVDEATRRRFETDIRESLSCELIGVDEEPILVTEIVELEIDDVKYRPNLRPVGQLHLKFATARPDLDCYLIGVKEGRYFISSFSPAPQ